MRYNFFLIFFNFFAKRIENFATLATSKYKHIKFLLRCLEKYFLRLE